MTIVSGLRIIDSNAQTGITWWNWTSIETISRLKVLAILKEDLPLSLLEMTKIAGALNMLPKTFLREGISNPSTKKAIEIYQADGNYPKFYRNFVGSSDNGRSSLPEMQFLSLKFDSKVNCPVLKSIIFSNSLVEGGRERALIVNEADGNYPKFYRNFVGSSDNGRSSLRIANTFSLEIVSIDVQFHHVIPV
jgi:hypothetical protein